MWKAVKESWNGIPPIVKGGVGIAVAVVSVNEYKKYRQRQLEKKAKALFDASNKKVVVTDGKGNELTVNINTAVTATKVYDAIHNNDIFGYTEDETAIVDELKKIPKAYIMDVQKNYFQLYGKIMQKEVIAALDQDEWKQVDYLFE